MLSNTSFSTAIATAAAIACTGRVVVAGQGTLVGELVRLSSPVEFLDNDGNRVQSTAAQRPPITDWASADNYGYQVQDATTGTMENPSAHCRELGGYIDDISKVVTQHISFARNTVRPLVTSFAEELQVYLQTTKPKEASEIFNIRTLRMPALLRDESFLDTLRIHKDANVISPDKSFTFESKTHEELTELVMLGHDRTNKLIAEWLSHKEENFLLNIWANFFSSSRIEGQISIQYEDLSRMNAFDKADYSLAILLIANKITEQVQESAMSLTVYKNMCSQYVQYAGALLVDSLVKLDLAIRTKALVISKNTFSNEIFLNGEVYTQWLEDGNSPEVILGLMVSNGTGTSVSMIDEKKDVYLNQWNSYVTFYRTKELNMAFDYAKRFIENAFAASLQQLEPTEIEFIEKNPKFLENISNNVRIALDNMKSSDLQDPYALALLFVAKIRFYYTSSYQILSDIEAASKANANVDVREAALLAVINYVSDFVSDQLTLSSN